MQLIRHARITSRTTIQALATTNCQFHTSPVASTRPKKTVPQSSTAPPEPAAHSPKIKRARTAYNYFVTQAYQDIKKETPDIEFKQTGSLMAERWKGMSEKEKKPFTVLAKKDKERYEAEKKKHNL